MDASIIYMEPFCVCNITCSSSYLPLQILASLIVNRIKTYSTRATSLPIFFSQTNLIGYQCHSKFFRKINKNKQSGIGSISFPPPPSGSNKFSKLLTLKFPIDFYIFAFIEENKPHTALIPLFFISSPHLHPQLPYMALSLYVLFSS